MTDTTRRAFIFEHSRPNYTDDRRTRDLVVRLVNRDAAGEVTYTPSEPLRGLRSEWRLWGSDLQAEPNAVRTLPHWNLGLADYGSLLTLEEARDAVQKLSKVVNGLAKIERDFGRVDAFGAFVQRLCKVVKAEAVGFFPPDGGTMWANGEAIHWLAPFEGGEAINRRVWDWKCQQGAFRNGGQ